MDRISNKKIQKITTYKHYKLICIRLCEISIWSPSKTWLSTCWRYRCWQAQRSDVCCSRFVHISGGILERRPLLLADTLQILKVLRLSLGNLKLQLPPQIFYGIKVRKLARPLHDLNVLLLKPLLCSHGHMFCVIVVLEDPSTTHFQCPGWGKKVVAHVLTVHGPIQPPLDAVKSSCPLSRETPPKHNVSTSMLDGGDGVLGVIVISLSPNTASQVDAKELDLVSSDHITFSQAFSESFRCSLATFRRACTCAFLSGGTLGVLQDFNP